MSDVDVIIQVHTQGVQQIGNLSASLRNLSNTLRGVTVPMSKLDAHTRAVHKALGITSRGVDAHAKSVRQLANNQKVLALESKRLEADLRNLKNAYALAGGQTTALGQSIGATTKELQAFSRAFKAMRLRALGSDIHNISLRMSKLGKDAQFVGRSLLINLTLPIATFARIGLQNFLAVEKQMVRITKVMEDLAPTMDVAAQKILGVGNATASMLSPQQQKQAEKLVQNFKDMNVAITDLSTKFAVSKDLVASISADFGELGLTAQKNVNKLTLLTLEIEKLGNMDIGPAQDLTQALYFQSRRALELTGALSQVTTAREREQKAIDASITQMYLFNAIENATALTLKDLGDSFAEVSAMATSYGLSMTEAAAMLAPMKAAGLDVGASANSIKVSLQRLLAPTKQNVDTLKKLAAQYGVAENKQNEFLLSTKTGLTGLEAVVKVFDRVRDSSQGSEGALRLMSDLFEKRQGPRMYLAIEQLSDFNEELRKVDKAHSRIIGTSTSAEVQLVKAAESAVSGFSSFNTTIVPKTIRSFKDIGIIARIAAGYVGQSIEIEPGKTKFITSADIKNAKAMRQATSDYVKEAKQAKGIDIISEVKTEAGRAMMIELAGAANAQQVAQQELDRSLQTTGVAVDRIKNAFKLFAADIISRLAPAIENISKKVVEMYETWMSPEFEKTRQTIINLITSLGSFLAVMGPIILAIGTFQSVVGKVGLGIARFIPKLRTVDGEFIGLGRSIDVARNSMNKLYESFVQLTGSRARPAALAPTPGGRIPQLPQAVTPAQRTRMLDQARRDAMNAAGVTAAERRAAQAEFRRGTRAPATGHRARGSTGRMLPRNVVEALRIMEARELADVTPTRTGLLRSPSTGRMVSPTSGAATIRENLLAPVRRQESIFARNPYFERAGIATDRMGTQFVRGGRRITEDQANRIARGGAGSLIARTQIAGSRIGQATMAPVRAIGRAGTAARAAMATAPSTGAGVVRGSVAATKSILRTTQAWQGASAALAAYNAKMLAFNAAPATGFKRLAIFITGFIRNMKLATIATKIFKMSLMFTGVGAIIAGIAAVVFLVIKNMDKIRGATKAWDALKRAFGLIKDAAMEIVRPIQDLFAQFGSGADEGEAAGQGIAKAFEGIARAVEFVAGLIKMIVTKVIKPYLYGIVNVVMAVVQLFKGNWKDALKFLLAAVSQISIGVISLFQMLAKAVISVMAGLAKGIVNLWFKGIVNGLYQAIVLALRGIVNLIGKIPGVNVITDPINNALKKVGGFISTVTSGVANTINKGIDGLSNYGKKAVDIVGDGLKNGLKKGADLGIKESSNAIKNDKKVPEEAKKQGDLAGEAIADAYGDAPIEGANDKIAGKIKEGIMDAVQKLQDYIAGRFASALKKFITDSVKALNKQKESALKVFDVQLNTLMKLEKAEESLTKKKEYETNRRKLIDDATLRGEVYRRNRALAIYEGRIDDARILDLEEQQAAKESTQELATLDESRRKDLAKENLEALRDAINNAKELAGKFFDESVEKFQEAAEHITRIAPVTIEQYTAQLAELQTLTTQTADTNNLEFGKMFEKFSTTIAEQMPNAVDDFGNALGAFVTPLDELVNLAMEKYGLGSENEASVLGVTRQMADAVIGITLGMLVDIGDTFVGESSNITEKFGNITGGIAGDIGTFKTEVLANFTTLLEETKTAFLTPYKKALDEADPATVFKNAIIDGNAEILRSFQNMVDLNPKLMKQLAASLDPAIKKYIELKAAIDAANEAAGGSGSGSSGIDSSSFGDAETIRFMRIRETAVANFRKSQQLQLDAFTRNLGVEDVVGLIGSSNLARFTQGRTLPSPKRMPITRAEGGPISKDAAFQSTPYGISGFLNAPEQKGIPAILHGGEFVVNADAVKRIGLGALAKLNDSRIPKFKKGGFVGTADQAERIALKQKKDSQFANYATSSVQTYKRVMEQIDTINIAKKQIEEESKKPKVVQIFNSFKKAGSQGLNAALDQIGKIGAQDGLIDKLTRFDSSTVDLLKGGVARTGKIVKGTYDNVVYPMLESYSASFTNPLVNLAGKAIGRKPNLREAGLMEAAVNTADIVTTVLSAGLSKAVVEIGEVGLMSSMKALSRGSVKTSSEMLAEKVFQQTTNKVAKDLTKSGIRGIAESAIISPIIPKSSAIVPDFVDLARKPLPLGAGDTTGRFLPESLFGQKLRNPINVTTGDLFARGGLGPYIPTRSNIEQVFRLRGQYFESIPGLIDSPVGFGFNIPNPKMAFPTLPESTELLQAQPFEIFDFGRGVLRMPSKNPMLSFTDRISPSQYGYAGGYDFAENYAFAQAAAQDLLLRARGVAEKMSYQTKEEALEYFNTGVWPHMADIPAGIYDNLTPSQVDFISLAASKGNAEAKQMFETLASLGKAMKQKELDIEKIRALSRIDKVNEDVIFDNLWWIREENPNFPMYDVVGNKLQVYPRSERFYPEGMMEVNGKTVTPAILRDTIHGAINHVVDGGMGAMMGRGNVSGATFYGARVKDIVDANVGSLATLYGADSYFVPPPFGALNIPLNKGGFLYKEGIEIGPGRMEDSWLKAIARHVATKKNVEQKFRYIRNPETDYIEDAVNIGTEWIFDQPWWNDELLSIMNRQKTVRELIYTKQEQLGNISQSIADKYPIMKFVQSLKGEIDPYFYQNPTFGTYYDQLAGKTKYRKVNIGGIDFDTIIPTDMPNLPLNRPLFPNFDETLKTQMAQDWANDAYPVKNELDKLLRDLANLDRQEKGKLAQRFFSGYEGSPLSYPNVPQLRQHYESMGMSPEQITEAINSDFKVQAANIKYSITRNAINSRLEQLAEQGRATIPGLPEPQRVDEATQAALDIISTDLGIINAAHWNTMAQKLEIPTQDLVNTGVLQSNQLATMSRNQILRHLSSSPQFIREYPDIFPGRYTRLEILGQMPFTSPIEKSLELPSIISIINQIKKSSGEPMLVPRIAQATETIEKALPQTGSLPQLNIASGITGVLDPVLQAKRATILQMRGMGGGGAFFSDIPVPRAPLNIPNSNSTEEMLDILTRENSSLALFESLRRLNTRVKSNVSMTPNEAFFVDEFTGAFNQILNLRLLDLHNDPIALDAYLQNILKMSINRPGPGVGHPLPFGEGTTPLLENLRASGFDAVFTKFDDVLNNPEIQKIVDMLLRDFARTHKKLSLALPDDTTVFRGLVLPQPSEDPFRYLRHLYAKGSMLPPHYISTSTNPYVAGNFTGAAGHVNLLEQITLPKGTEVLAPAHWGVGLQNEKELILPPAYRLKINDMEQTGVLHRIFATAVKTAGASLPIAGAGMMLSDQEKALANFSKNQNPIVVDRMEEKVQKFYSSINQLKDFIAAGESINALDPYSAWAKPGAPGMIMPGMTSMKIGEIINAAQGHAVGKYQNMPPYLLQRAKVAGYNIGTIFTPDVQEAIMLSTLMSSPQDAGTGLTSLFNRRIGINTAVDRIANMWRSMSGTGGQYVGGGTNPQGKDLLRKDLVIKKLLEQMMANYPGFKKGGYVKGAVSRAIPATLHGGEYVLNAKAVSALGIPTLNALNMINPSNRKKPDPDHPSRRKKIPQSPEVVGQLEKTGGIGKLFPAPYPGRPFIPMNPPPESLNFRVPTPSIPSNNFRFAPPASRINTVQAPTTNNVSTVNIQVENFIGQEEWFHSMMKEYNVNVLPKNQKLAGLEQRKFTSYNGINQGM